MRALSSLGPPEDCFLCTCAVKRARPKVYCFGHIHEGYGAGVVRWKEKQWEGLGMVEPEVLGKEGGITCLDGRETLMVNASVMDVRYRPVNAPWIVEVELPSA
jgi:hypothetical protein